jgi:crossover junction endodeoxyribonuclease RuvC
VIRVVGLDLSLTSAGIARLQVDDQGAVSSWTGTVGSAGTDGATLLQRWLRLDHQAGAVADLVPADVDLVVIESPAFSSQQGNAFDRSGLWWMTLDRLMSAPGLNSLRVAEVATQSLNVYATAYGGSDDHGLGDLALGAAAREHWGLHFDIDNDDIADAVVLAAMGARWLGHPIDRLPHTHARAIASAHWPTRKD